MPHGRDNFRRRWDGQRNVERILSMRTICLFWIRTDFRKQNKSYSAAGPFSQMSNCIYSLITTVAVSFGSTSLLLFWCRKYPKRQHLT